MDLNCLTNINFEILKYLYEIKDKNNCARITQEEIAEAMNLSRMTIYKILKELKNKDFVIQDKAHIGRYILTDNAIEVIETIDRLR